MAGTFAWIRKGGPVLTARRLATYALDRDGRRAEIGRLRFFDRAGEHTPLLGVALDHATVLVNANDTGIERRLFVRGYYNDARVLEAALDVIGSEAGSSRRGTFVDVGASTGTTTLLAACEHGFERVLAIEPEPANFRMLRANIALNGLRDRVGCVRAAVTSEEGEARLALRDRSSNHRLVGEAHDKYPTITVPAVTLDGLAVRGDLDPAAAGLVWIDAEGHELEILEGAGTVLEAGVPVVCELQPPKQPERAERLRDLVATRFARYADLRAAVRGGGRPQARPAAEFADAIARYRESGSHLFTDVLLLP